MEKEDLPENTTRQPLDEAPTVSPEQVAYSSTLPYPSQHAGRTDYPVQPMRDEVVQMKGIAKDPTITYEREDFQYGSEDHPRERVSKVIIYKKGRTNRDAPNNPVSFLSKDSNTWDDRDGWHRGHVAARFLGGSYASYNMVPMLPGFNTGPWRREEDNIAEEVQAGNPVTICPEYGGADPRIPDRMHVESAGGYNNRVNHEVPLRSPMDDDEYDAIAKIDTESDNRSYALGLLQGEADKGYIPSNYLNSPYLILDIAWLNGGWDANPGSRKSFESWQFDMLVRFNMRLNGGIIESDAWIDPLGDGTPQTNEPHQILAEDGRKDLPQADHIVPESRGGANFFCNARLVSWELNNSIERVVDAHDKIMKW